MRDQDNLSEGPEKGVLEEVENKFCGIVMPISSMEGCPASHWEEVRGIIDTSIVGAGFKPRLVSQADDSGVIQKRIIHNLYHDEIVVCDVSAKNPNVMFELGLRLAFDRPTIIVKDNETDYSFDTSVIEHLNYPRDLRHGAIEIFKEQLSKKIKATHAKLGDDKYTTFLGHFGEFKVASIEQKEVGVDDYIISELKDISRRLERTENYVRAFASNPAESVKRNTFKRDMDTFFVEILGLKLDEEDVFNELINIGIPEYVQSYQIKKIKEGAKIIVKHTGGVEVESELKKIFFDHFSDRYLVQF